MKPKNLKELRDFINSIELPEETPVITLDLKYDDERSSINDAAFQIEELDRVDMMGEPNGEKEKVLLITVESFDENK